MGNEDEMFCLMMKKCGCGTGGTEGGKLPDLSNEEQYAGFNDINGDKVYCKTIAFGGVLNEGHYRVAHGLENIGRFIDLKTRCYLPENKTTYFDSWATSNTYLFRFSINANEIHCYSHGQAKNEWTIEATVYYTCTDR